MKRKEINTKRQSWKKRKRGKRLRKAGEQTYKEKGGERKKRKTDAKIEKQKKRDIKGGGRELEREI